MISSEIGTGTTYINIDGDTGLVVPPADPIALQNAMKKLWLNPELAKQMGQRAEFRYKKIFTAEKMIKQYCDLYQGIYKRR
jgi:rhamnosyl/mannosyltransferase